MCQAPDQLAARCHQLFHSNYDVQSHGWQHFIPGGQFAFYRLHLTLLEQGAEAQQTLSESDNLKRASTAHTHTYSTMSFSWCNGSESRRCGEAGAEQRASGLILGPGPKHCLTKSRGGQARTTEPRLKRLHITERTQTTCTWNKPWSHFTTQVFPHTYFTQWHMHFSVLFFFWGNLLCWFFSSVISFHSDVEFWFINIFSFAKHGQWLDIQFYCYSSAC